MIHGKMHKGEGNASPLGFLQDKYECIKEFKMQTYKVVSREEWLVARKEHLAKEKEFTRLRDQLSQQRRELPWVKVEKPYMFHSPNGKESLAELFEGRTQLLVYHFMYSPDWDEGCPSCSLIAAGSGSKSAAPSTLSL